MIRTRMKRFRYNRLLCFLIVVTDLTGLLFLFGVFQKEFHPDRFGTFTFIASLNVLLYYLLNFFHLKHSSAIYIPGWKFSAFIDLTSMAVYGLIYLFGSIEKSDISLHRGTAILWIILPLLLLVDWGVNEKRHTHYRFILIALFLPVLYMVLALILGANGHGIGISGNAWPYPFMNVDQLGWKLVIESCILRFLFWCFYGWLAVRTDRYLGKRKRF